MLLLLVYIDLRVSFSLEHFHKRIYTFVSLKFLMASGKVRGHDSELLWPLLKIYNFHTNFKFWFTKIKLWVGNMPFCLNGHYATIKFILYYMCTHKLIFLFQYHIQEQLKKPGVFKLWLILISTNVTFMPDLEDTTKNILQVVLYLFIPQRVHAQIQKIVPREGGGVQCIIKFSWRRGGGSEAYSCNFIT